MGMEHRRGASPPNKDWARDKTGEGSGHEVKKHKGGGYARSTHMKGDVGPQSKGHFAGGPHGHTAIHTGLLSTSETKEHGSGYKLPMEKNVPYRKGIDSGDHFEGEIKEHFPTKKGVAGIHAEAMPHKNSPIEVHDEGGHGHTSGKAEHLPGLKEAHAFKPPTANMAHGYGHDGEKRKGFLRLSGHKQAHRIGKR